MASLKEYRFSRDPEREKPAPAAGAPLVAEEEPGKNTGVSAAISRAREVVGSRGVGGAHKKIMAAGKVVDAVLNFGRHKGKKLSELKVEEPTYIAWLLSKPYDPVKRPDGFPAEFIEIVSNFV